MKMHTVAVSIAMIVLSLPFAVAAGFALLAASIGLATTARVGPVLSPLTQVAASWLGLLYFWVALRRHRRSKDPRR